MEGGPAATWINKRAQAVDACQPLRTAKRGKYLIVETGAQEFLCKVPIAAGILSRYRPDRATIVGRISGQMLREIRGYPASSSRQ